MSLSCGWSMVWYVTVKFTTLHTVPAPSFSNLPVASGLISVCPGQCNTQQRCTVCKPVPCTLDKLDAQILQRRDPGAHGLLRYTSLRDVCRLPLTCLSLSLPMGLEKLTCCTLLAQSVLCVAGLQCNCPTAVLLIHSHSGQPATSNKLCMLQV